MNKIILLLSMILFISFVYSECSDGQININLANLEELDKITQIGPATAQKIIDARPFKSIDDLLNVYGIGETKLSKIKTENLACVDNQEEFKEDESLEKKEEHELKNNYEKERGIEDSFQEIEEVKEVSMNVISTGEVIKLNPKDIKTNKLSQNLDKETIAKWLLIPFCWILFSLFLLKRKKRTNEFREN